MSQNGDWLVKITKKARKIIKLFGLVILIAATISAFMYTRRPTIDVPANVEVLAARSTNCNIKTSANKVKDYIVKIENKTDQQTIIGSGFFDKNGYLITNSHIVDTPGEITVYFPNGSKARARLVENDTSRDIALLETNLQSVTALPWAETAELKPTDSLNILGYSSDNQTVSIVSSTLTARKLLDNVTFLQTDKSINSSSSGGPLLNACGGVVGINTYSEGNQDINLAITSESIKTIIKDLINNNYGPQYISTDHNTLLTKQNDLKDSDESNNSQNGTNSSSNTSPNQNENNKKKTIPPSCGLITTFKDTLEINEKTVLYFSYVGDQSIITWSGGGTFQDDEDPSETKSIVKWSSATAGDYILTVKAENKAGECKQTILIHVLSPLSRVDNLAKAYASGLNSYYDPVAKELYYKVTIHYQNSSNQSINDINKRAYTMPISVNLQIMKSTTHAGETPKMLLNRTYSNSEIISEGSYRIIIIRQKDLNISDADIETRDNGAKVVNIYDYFTLNTPEQGYFQSPYDGPGTGSAIYLWYPGCCSN